MKRIRPGFDALDANTGGKLNYGCRMSSDERAHYYPARFDRRGQRPTDPLVARLAFQLGAAARLGFYRCLCSDRCGRSAVDFYGRKIRESYEARTVAPIPE